MLVGITKYGFLQGTMDEFVLKGDMFAVFTVKFSEIRISKKKRGK